MDSSHEGAPIDSVIEKAGGQAALARGCSVTPQAVSQWIRKGRFPTNRVLQVEALTGVSRHELRPDIYGERPQ